MTSPIRGLVLTETDNVAMILMGGQPGAQVDCGTIQVTLCDPVPYGHKIAVKPIRAGETITKYGYPIGVAACDIAPGQHVHIHNVLGHRPALRGREEG